MTKPIVTKISSLKGKRAFNIIWHREIYQLGYHDTSKEG